MSIYPHIATAWIKTTVGREAEWERIVFSRCRLDVGQGALPGVNGDTSARSATMLVPTFNTPLKKGDRVVLGLSTLDDPPQDALHVETVEPISIRSTPHHWEISLS